MHPFSKHLLFVLYGNTIKMSYFRHTLLKAAFKRAVVHIVLRSSGSLQYCSLNQSRLLLLYDFVKFRLEPLMYVTWYALLIVCDRVTVFIRLMKVHEN